MPEAFRQFYKYKGWDEATITGLWASLFEEGVEQVFDTTIGSPTYGKAIARGTGKYSLSPTGQQNLLDIASYEKVSTAEKTRIDNETYRAATLANETLQRDATTLQQKNELVEAARQADAKLALDREQLAQQAAEAEKQRIFQGEQAGLERGLTTEQLAWAKERFGRELTSQEKQTLDQLVENQRQFDLQKAQETGQFEKTFGLQQTQQGIESGQFQQRLALQKEQEARAAQGQQFQQGIMTRDQQLAQLKAKMDILASPADYMTLWAERAGGAQNLAPGLRELGGRIPTQQEALLPPGQTLRPPGLTTGEEYIQRGLDRQPTQAEIEETRLIPPPQAPQGFAPPFLQTALTQQPLLQPRTSFAKLTGLPYMSGQSFGNLSPSEQGAYMQSYKLLGAPAEDLAAEYYKTTKGFGRVPQFTTRAAPTFRFS